MPTRAADIIIVGGGIAGLYTAARLVAQEPDAQIIILEKNKRLGGRAGNARFRGASVVTGAGIGRVGKDYLLADLLETLGLDINTWPMHGHLKPGPLRRLKAALTPAATRETFENYGKRILGATEFARWIADLGYTDLFLANAYDTVLNYGLEDFTRSTEGFTVPWAEIVRRLAAGLPRGRVSIIRECTALSIDEAAKKIKTDHGSFKWRTGLVIASTIDCIRALLPDVPEYKYIRGQPFMRVYAQFAEGAPALPIKEHTIVGGLLQKIIPIDAEKRIYMIAYNDNAAAEELHNDAPDYHKELVKIFGPGVPKIAHIRTFYWPIGTHYTTPHPYDPDEFRSRLINPRPGIYVVGEAVSVHQGWTQGALETIHAALSKSWTARL